jgi:predicted DNA-binding transcriptional regulator YafY
MKNEKQVLLCNYHSGNSQTFSNRLVEPFALSDSFNLVWCYDLGKHTNRQFKVARISDITTTPLVWENKIYHKTTPSDVFRNTGLLDKQIEIKLNLRAHNLLIKEYPLAERYLRLINKGWYCLKCDVSLYEGPCRFILGLWNDVEIIGSNEFIAFVENKIKKLNSLENSE